MKKLPVIIFCLSFFLLNAFSSKSQSTVCIEIRPSKAQGNMYNADIATQFPNANYANDSDFMSETWTCQSTLCVGRGLIKFDMSSIPANSTIVSATLSLYANSNTLNGIQGQPTYGSDNAAWLKCITSPWLATAVTWNNQPTTTDLHRILIPTSTNTSENYSINVTQLVIDQIANTNYGFEMMDTNEVTYYNSLIFGGSSKADSNQRPQLVICYIPPAACITITPDDSTAGVDASAGSNFPNTSYPSAPDFQGSTWTCNAQPCWAHSFMNPNLSVIPANAVIDSATLYLYADTSSLDGIPGQPTYGSNNPGWLQRVTSPWNINTLTWNNQPTTTAVNEVTIPQSINTTESYAVNVTQLITDIINSGNNNGFMLRDTNETTYYNSLIFCSDNYPNAAKHPKLDVCYHIGTGVAAINSTPQITVYPNPATDKVVFRTTLNNMDNTHVDIYNALGQLVHTYKLYPIMTTISTSDLPRGLYLYRVLREDSVLKTGKLVLQ